LSVTDDSAYLKRAAQLFQEIDRRLYDNMKRSGLSQGWEVTVNPESTKLAVKRDAAIENLRQFGVTREKAEEWSREWRQQWDKELDELAGITHATAEPVEPQQSSHAASTREKPKRARRRKKRILTRRERDILGVIQLGSKGAKYSRDLESRKISPEPRWIAEGCPATYPEAYKIPKWRQRLQDEKWRLAKLLRH
jgi:hypothetical protein